MGGPPPTELAPVSLGPYTVAPPDILVIDAPQLFPRGYQIQPFDVLEILIFQPSSPLANGDPAKKGLKETLIAGDFKVTPEGKVLLPILGMPTAIPVAGLTVEQATQAIHGRLSQALKNVDVFVNLKTFRPVGQLQGRHLVRPDGTISLGTYGYVYVAGMTLGQIKCVVEKHLSKYVLNPQISVDVAGYNSKKYYLIIDGGGYGQLVFAYPYTGNEFVLDSVSKLQGLPWWASKKKIWVARPAPCNNPCLQVLPVDWNAITQGGATCTNWQLMPGDRVYVRADCLIAANNWITKVLNPVNNILNTTLLGATTVNTISGENNGNGSLFVVP
jgi:protein involved in polysaccharide export with SLBB domain